MAASSSHVFYEHRQIGWPMLCSALLPFVCLAAYLVSVPTAERNLPPLSIPILGGFVAVLLLGFSTLSVFVTSTHVVLSFGIGLYRRAIPLARIRDAALARSRWYEGWGVHWTPRGMLYNVGGFDAVALTLDDNRSVRIGSDEAPRLRAAVVRALAGSTPRPGASG